MWTRKKIICKNASLSKWPGAHKGYVPGALLVKAHSHGTTVLRLRLITLVTLLSVGMFTWFDSTATASDARLHCSLCVHVYMVRQWQRLRRRMGCLDISKSVHTRNSFVAVIVRLWDWPIVRPIWSKIITARNEVGTRLYFHGRLWFC